MVWPPDDRIRRAFSETAHAYDHLARRRYRRIAREVIDAAGVTSRDRVLDIASGSGLVGRMMAERGVRWPVEIDISASLLRLSSGPKRVCGHAQRLPFPPAAFDAALCSLGLNMFENPGAGLSEMHRVLSPGGRAAVSVWGADTAAPLDTAVREVLDEMARETVPAIVQDVIDGRDELAEALSGSGFVEVKAHVTRKRAAYRDSAHYVDMLSVFPSTWVRLNALADGQEQARIAASAAVERAVGRAGRFEVVESVIIASARRGE